MFYYKATLLKTIRLIMEQALHITTEWVDGKAQSNNVEFP